jgi:hypothetical protein
MTKPIFNERTGNYLYIAVDSYEGDLVGAGWFKTEDEAFDYFFGCWPPLVADTDDLHVSLADETECSLDTIIAEFPDIADGEGCDTYERFDPDYLKDSRYDAALRDLDESQDDQVLTESYRRTVSRGASLNDNPLFVDFD